MVKDHADSERRNQLPPHGLLFLISSKGSFICTIPQTAYHIPWPLLHQSASLNEIFSSFIPSADDLATAPSGQVIVQVMLLPPT